MCAVCGWTQKHPDHLPETSYYYCDEGYLLFLLRAVKWLSRKLKWRMRTYYCVKGTGVFLKSEECQYVTLT